MVFSHIVEFAASIVAGYVVGRAVFAPGVVNAHRVRGAGVLYLNFAMIFLTAYRLVRDISPDAFAGLSVDLESWLAALLQFCEPNFSRILGHRPGPPGRPQPGEPRSCCRPAVSSKPA